jgi:PBP1b-binding outer membrane lipoprotein LpoB
MKRILLIGGVALTLAACQQETAVKEKKKVQTYEMTTEIPTGILTPDKVETSIGTLAYFDGVPTKTTCRECI